jgi:predicted AAA+ superfamily ATPase
MAASKDFRTGYARRVIDDELDDLLNRVPAILIDGPRGVGKTATALQRATKPLWLAHRHRVINRGSHHPQR